MTDSLVAQLEDWMREVGHSEPADARAIVAGLVLPRRSMGRRSGGAMFAKVAMAVAMVVVVGVGVANLGSIGGFGQSPIVGPPSTSASTPDPCPAALIEGELVASEAWGLALLDTDGVTREVVWPDGYHVSQRPPTIVLLDAGGEAIAFAGDRVQIGGGATGIGGALVACGGITVVSRPSPTVSPEADPVPTTRLTLTTEYRERCGSIGGCAAYVGLTRPGQVPVWVRLDGPGSYDPALPALIGPGSYTVRFRLAAVSDDILNGAPPDETTIATCEAPFGVFKETTAVSISVTFSNDSCEASGTATVEVP